VNDPEKFTDEHGACKICEGEIPYGHLHNCYLWKQEQKIKELQNENLILRKHNE